MAHGEVAHGAEGERCCALCDQGHHPLVRPQHRLLGPRRLTEHGSAVPEHEAAAESSGQAPAAGADDDGALPGWGPTCRSDQDGWAGAHRHGAVRPRKRKGRRERPPRRWC